MKEAGYLHLLWNKEQKNALNSLLTQFLLTTHSDKTSTFYGVAVPLHVPNHTDGFADTNIGVIEVTEAYKL